ncbi:hypothetical protein [Pseudoalteromonas sp. EB27]|uniref:hypothetical protein n=1 Tax=Pseudoalteromonas sp. EB27 TaxID=1938368 RepID=UPI0009F96A99|nr:hypothetical protein [Pseudoalteromonas sp. EB27]
MKYVSLLTALLPLLFLSTISVAGTLTCAGKVEKVALHAPDKLMLKLTSMNQSVFICSPEYKWTVPGTSYTTSAETCKVMISMLMHAKSTQADMGNVWFDGSDVPSSCSGWSSWKKANVRYFAY